MGTFGPVTVRVPRARLEAPDGKMGGASVAMPRSAQRTEQARGKLSAERGEVISEEAARNQTGINHQRLEAAVNVKIEDQKEFVRWWGKRHQCRERRICQGRG
jgi:hypothetical protein